MAPTKIIEVKEKFDHHFIAKKKVIYERAKFNQRAQGQDELVENFIADLSSSLILRTL